MDHSLMNNVLFFPDLEAISVAAAHTFVYKCHEILLTHKYFHVALSGGNTPARLYELLSDNYFAKNINWDRVKLALVDERHVPTEHDQNNYRMIHEKLIANIQIPLKNIAQPVFDIDINIQALNYQNKLSQIYLKPFPQFHFMIMGMGVDGHTASLFPGNSVLQVKKKSISAVYLPGNTIHRITMTIPVLQQADTLLYLVSGEDKKSALQDVINNKKSLLPAALFTKRAIFYCDQPIS